MDNSAGLLDSQSDSVWFLLVKFQGTRASELATHKPLVTPIFEQQL